MFNKRYVLSKVPVPDGSPAFLVYDLKEERIIHEISNYSTYLINERSNSSLTVYQALNHLIEFWKFMVDEVISLNSISNHTIRAFRDLNYRKVRGSRAHRGGEDQAKLTVNLKLERIYDWINWLQLTRQVPIGTIGRHGLVVSISDASTVGRRGRGRRVPGEGRKYPLLYRVSKRNAKHSAPASVVTERDVNDLMAQFASKFGPFIAQRNILFVDIAESTGFRRGSICSLRVDQFEVGEIERADGEYLVRPSKQKFGYTKTFGIEITLAYRILEFIENYWKPWVAKYKIPAGVHRNALFLSEKSGQPILERSMTQAISSAFRELGFGKGVGPHTLRGKFASTLADMELAERRELGLDTSNRSIAAAVAMKLGHDDPDQFYRYASSSQARQARIAREGRSFELKSLREEVKNLKAQLALLEAVDGNPEKDD